MRNSFRLFASAGSGSSDMGWNCRNCWNFSRLFDYSSSPPLKRGQAQLLADFPGREIFHLRVASDGGLFLVGRILVNGVFPSFPYQHATVISQIFNEVPPFHDLILYFYEKRLKC